MTDRLGRADLHIHTLASDGTAGVAEILDHVERNTPLDVIAITDHERIDAALAARSMARDRGLRVDVIVGEEVTTLGGHLLALFIEERVRPLRSLRTTIGEIHEHGVVLTLTAAEAEALPEPSENPAVMEDDPSEPDSSPVADKLRRAWDLLSGNY